MGIEETRRAVEDFVNERGAVAKQIWSVMAGFNLIVSPEFALDNLKRLSKFWYPSLRLEARKLITGITRILKNPPLP